MSLPPTGLRVYNGNIAERDNTDGTMITQNDLALVWTAPSDDSAVSYNIRTYSIQAMNSLIDASGNFNLDNAGLSIFSSSVINILASQVAGPNGQAPLFGQDLGMGYNAPTDSSGNLALTDSSGNNIIDSSGNVTIFSFTHSYLLNNMLGSSLLFTVTSVNSSGSESLPVACVFDRSSLLRYSIIYNLYLNGFDDVQYAFRSRAISFYSKPVDGDNFLTTTQSILLEYRKLLFTDDIDTNLNVKLPLLTTLDINKDGLNVTDYSNNGTTTQSQLDLPSIHIMDGSSVFIKILGLQVNFKSHQSMSFNNMGYLGYPETSIPDHYHRINIGYELCTHLTTTSVEQYTNTPNFTDPNMRINIYPFNQNNPFQISIKGETVGKSGNVFLEQIFKFNYKDSSGNIYPIASSSLPSGFSLSDFSISYTVDNRRQQNSNNVYFINNFSGASDLMETMEENMNASGIPVPYNLMDLINPSNILVFNNSNTHVEKKLSSDFYYYMITPNYQGTQYLDPLTSVSTTSPILCLSPFTMPRAAQVMMNNTSGTLAFNMQITNYQYNIPLNDFTITCSNPAVTVPAYTLADLTSIDIIKYNIRNQIPVNNGFASFITTDTSGNKIISYMYQLKVNGLQPNTAYQFQITPKPKLLAGETVTVPFDYLYYQTVDRNNAIDAVFLSSLYNGVQDRSYYWLAPLPPAPTNVQATLKSLGIATVTWDAPTPLIAPLASYTVFTDPLIDASGVTVLPDSSGNLVTTVDYPGLVSGISYKFTVLAATAVTTNPNATSMRSSPSASLLNATLANTPTNLRYEVINDDKIKFSWTAPSGADTGGTPITGYKFQILNVIISGSPFTLGTVTSCTISGFSAVAKQFTASVFSINAVGVSPYRVFIAVNTERPVITGTPPVITNIVRNDANYLLSANKAASVTVSWNNLTAPADYYITSYIVIVHKSNQSIGPEYGRIKNLYPVSNPSQVSTRPTTLTTVIEKLTYGTQYAFSLSCYLASVNNPRPIYIYAITSTAFTPTTTCGPVTNVAFSMNSSKDLTVSWRPPVNTGGLPITGYSIDYQSNTSLWSYPFNKYSVTANSNGTSVTILRSKSLTDFVTESGLPAFYATYMKSAVGVNSITITPLNNFAGVTSSELVGTTLYNNRQ